MRRTLLALMLLALAATPADAATARPTTAQTLAAARALGVGDDAAKLQERFLPAARLVPSATASRTHLGGSPDLPHGTAWPTCHGGHRLTLLAQIDLRDLARAVPGATRARGTLAVFASMVVDRKTGYPEIDPWSGGLSPGKCYRVLYSPSRGRLARRATPRGTKAFKNTSLRLRPTLTVPGWETAQDSLGHRVGDGWLTLTDRAAWGDPAHAAPYRPQWQALGWSNPIQADPTSKHGCVSAHQPEGPKRLLLQLDADEDRLDFDDSAGGQLQITVPAADLRAGRFDRLCGEYQFD